MIRYSERGNGHQLVIGLHFLGADTATTDRLLFEGLDGDYRFLFPVGENSIDGAVSWFPEGYYEATAERQAETVAAIVAELADTAKPLVGEPPIVLGASQGGDLAAAWALLRPETLRMSLAIAANTPSPLVDGSTSTPPLRLFHGTADDVVPISTARSHANRLGVGLSEYPGVGHAVPEAMRRDVHRAIREAARADG